MTCNQGPCYFSYECYCISSRWSDCIDVDWICDGDDDCDSAEDEVNCPGATTAPTTVVITTASSGSCLTESDTDYDWGGQVGAPVTLSSHDITSCRLHCDTQGASFFTLQSNNKCVCRGSNQGSGATKSGWTSGEVLCGGKAEDFTKVI